MNGRGIRTTIIVLSAAVAILAAASLVTIPISQVEVEEGGRSGKALNSVVRLFSLDGEGNIPTWFSSVILLAASALLGVIARSRMNSRDRFATHWVLLALVFLYISVDETARIHEMLNTPVSAMVDTGGFLSFAWVLFGALFVAVMAVIYFRFLVSLPGSTRNAFLIAGTIFVVGAIGFESLSAYFYSQSGYRDARYLLASNVEEIMEMTGVVIFLYALLRYIAVELPRPLFGVVRSQYDSRSDNARA